MDKAKRLASYRLAVYALVSFACALLVGRTVITITLNNIASVDFHRQWLGESRMFLPECSDSQSLLPTFNAAELSNKLSPDYQRAWVNLGRYAWLQDDCDRAYAYWKKALALSETDEVTRLLVSLSGKASGNANSWTDYLSVQEAHSYAVALATELETLGQNDKALEWYEESFKYGLTYDAVKQTSKLYILAGNREAASDIWAELSRVFPTDQPLHWWALGQSAELREQWQVAALAYEKGANLAEENFEYFLRLGGVLQRVDPERAEEAYQQALQSNSDSIWPYLGLGHVAFNQGNFNLAQVWYEEAERIAPEDINPKYYLGVLFFAQQNYEKACSYFSRALSIDPRHYQSNHYATKCNVHVGHLNEAVK